MEQMAGPEQGEIIFYFNEITTGCFEIDKLLGLLLYIVSKLSC